MRSTNARRKGNVGAIDPGHLYPDHRAAEFLGISVRTLQNWRRPGLREQGPVFVKFGRVLRYEGQALIDFIRRSRSDAPSPNVRIAAEVE